MSLESDPTAIANGTGKIKVLVADDDPHMQQAIRACLSRGDYNFVIVANGLAALEQLEAESFDLVITDQQMPQMSGLELLATMQKRAIETPVIMITAYGTINQAVEAMQLGAADFITKPFSAGDFERVVARVLAPENGASRQRALKTKNGRPIITNDPLMIRVLEVAEAVSRSDATVLIQGESGTGKELIARFIHACSLRAQAPFVAVNCAALPETLLESELFGHEKGAFTGAQTRKIGKFELAHGGTILLDEISEMDLALQAKLLRVLQEREVDRVGGKEPVQIDVRVLATTNRDLEDYVREGKFRADLYYRLNVIPVTLPPLRQRASDIRLLTEHFMRQFLGEKAPPLPNEVLDALVAHPWPGNVRELQNAVQRAAILSQGKTPREGDFLLSANPLAQLDSIRVEARPYQSIHSMVEKEVLPSAESSSAIDSMQIRSGVTVQEMEKALILETLRATDNNRTEAAKLLGISIRTLRNKLHEYKGQGGALEDDGVN
ncbi:MAG: sigma-54-dependent transcriptional regulator [Pseudomonadota bacterium]|jgi:DNA-binding NtrC family response regulator